MGVGVSVFGHFSRSQSLDFFPMPERCWSQSLEFIICSGYSCMNESSLPTRLPRKELLAAFVQQVKSHTSNRWSAINPVSVA